MTQKIDLKYADLFCGLGAFHLAFDRLNKTQDKYIFSCVFACDNNPSIQKIYYENYNLMPQGDIFAIEPESIPDFDVLCAGFPCIPFSRAGKKLGLQDAKSGNCFYGLLKIVDAKQPSVLLLENVKNLQSIDDGNTFTTILAELQARDYKVSYKVLDSKYFNCPQSRERLYIVCQKDSLFVFPQVSFPLLSVASIIDSTETAFLNYADKYDLAPCPSKKHKMKYQLYDKVSGKGGYQGYRVYDLSQCGVTVCASSGGLGRYTGLYDFGEGKIRPLNLKETLRMFCFPASFSFDSHADKSKISLLGNSIVVEVLVTLLQQIFADGDKKKKS